uniref:Glycosyltransferase n=1 Tax=Dictyoglomus turgidum TaxID=513050 RepID=A0A7C3SNL8_9BACT
MSKVLTVIPTINLWKEYTEPCLKSVISNNTLKFLIIDNGSVDETKEELPKLLLKRDDIDYVINYENWGCARTWNYGMKIGFEDGFDYVLILNNDVLLHPNCVDRLVERFQRKDPDVVLVSAMDIRGECIVPSDIFKKDDKEKEKVSESENPNFAAFMVNKKFWKKVGEFDEGFFPAYFEDNDMHYRIKLAGLKAVCYPPALFYHYGSRTQNDLRYPGGLVPSNQFLKNRDYYISKWGGMPGQEKFIHPFNDKSKSIKWTKQKEEKL